MGTGFVFRKDQTFKFWDSLTKNNNLTEEELGDMTAEFILEFMSRNNPMPKKMRLLKKDDGINVWKLK